MSIWDSLFSSPDASTSARRTEDESIGEPAARPEPEEHPRSSFRTILIFSAVLVPVAAVPYVLVRRHYVTLLKEVAALQTASASLAREVRKAVADLSKERSDLSRGVLRTLDGHTRRFDTSAEALAEQAAALLAVRVSLEEANTHLGDLHGKVNDFGRNVAVETKNVRGQLFKTQRAVELQEAEAQRWRNETSNNIARLLAENERRRTIYSEAVKETGRSLADVARFMQEVEMREGWTPLPDDGRGIDRIRNAAKHLDEVGQPLPTEDGQSEPESTSPYAWQGLLRRAQSRS
ncbi:hypothetical protein BD309DRAFT_947120 [Dichomitus squalens]|nr:hypothetical protein BD309DRAFT_947120 [Dichomitus squalens]